MAHNVNVGQNDNSKSNAASAAKSLVKFVEKVYGAVGEYVPNKDGTPKYMYFQDQSMKDIFNFFPDRVCIDVSYKKFETDLYMYLFCCEDSNGKNHIIAVGFLNANDQDSIQWLFRVFKKHNPNWRKIRVISAHPHIKPREILGLFPQAIIIVCYVQAVSAFTKDIEKLSFIEDIMINLATELFTSLYKSESPNDYDLAHQVYNSLPEPLIAYFEKNWLNHCSEWRISLDYNRENIFMQLNLFLEDLYKSIRAVLATESCSVEFIKKMFIIISLKKREKSSFVDPVSNHYSRFSPEYQISNTLTPYAAQFVINQLDASHDIIIDVNSVSESYIFKFSDVVATTTVTVCSCNFYLLTMLPCKHIFAVRNVKYYCVFEESMVNYTWNMRYYQNALICMKGHFAAGVEKRIPGDLPSRVVLASHLFEISLKPLFESSKKIFDSRLQLLNKMVQAWKEDNEVNLQFLGIDEVPDRSTVRGASNVLPLAFGTGCNVEKLFIWGTGCDMDKALTLDSHCSMDKALTLDSHCSMDKALTLDSHFNIDKNLASDSPCKVDKPSTSVVRYSMDKPSTMGPHCSLDKLSTLGASCNVDKPSTSSGCYSIDKPTIPSSFCSIDKPKIPSSFCSIDKPSVSGACNVDKPLVAETSISTEKRCVQNSKSQYSFEEIDVQGLKNFFTTILSRNRINLAYAYCVICLTKASCVAWLRHREFLPSSMKCPSCGHEMTSKVFSRLTDGVAWCCTKTEGKNCSKKCSVRYGTWFESSNLSLEQILLICYMWMNRFTKSQIIQELGITAPTYLSMEKFFQRVCERSLSSGALGTDGKMSSDSYVSPLDRWLEENGIGDTFLKFLKDCVRVHQEDMNLPCKDDFEE